jgi:hypothetical protein
MNPERRDPRDDGERRLEALLDRWPEPEVPAGLAERVLAATAAERARGARGRARPGPGRRAASWALACAALLALAVAAGLWREGGAEQAEPAAELARGPAAPAPAELLAHLELLEDWELLVTDDLDLLLAALDEMDEVLLGIDAEAADTNG